MIWLDGNGDKVDSIKLFEASRSGRLDRSIWISQARDKPLAMRLVALRRPQAQAVAALAKARRRASDRCGTILPGTLITAESLIILTLFERTEHPEKKVLELYRLH